MTDFHPLLCARCGAALPSALGGMCPRCLLSAGLESPASFQEEPFPGADGTLPRFGKYELMERIARGGMGLVYKARDVELDRPVALKMIAEAELDSDTQVQDMRAEARIAASLDHPNIVHIYEVGEHEGWHYFAMQLMEGGSLADRMRLLDGYPQDKAARLLETIARAVHYAHQRRVLHRDLKPANVLLDSAGVPHVADFGVAKLLDKEDAVAQSGLVVGTLGYMAPEQAEPQGQPLTVAADVYSLGVILYELLTGRPPFEADSREQMLALVLGERPQAPRELKKSISRELEAICLKCLEKDPAQRYGSAAELADDLLRYLEGKETVALSHGRLGRTWLWCVRHPLVVGLLATLLGALVVAVGPLNIASALADRLRAETLRANENDARLIAGSVLSELEQYSRDLESAAKDPELVAALQARSPETLERFCERQFKDYDYRRGSLRLSGVCFVLDETGRGLARWPNPRNRIVGKDYAWRDYFQGVLRLLEEGRRGTYVSRAFLAESDYQYAFALSVPVFAKDGKWLGVLLTTSVSGPALGARLFDDSSDSTRTAMLVAPADRTRQEAPIPDRDLSVVLVHEQPGRGRAANLAPQTAGLLAQPPSKPSPRGPEQFLLSASGGGVLEGYRDPESDELGTWVVASARVGRTGLAVIVGTWVNLELAVTRRLVSRSVPVALGTGLFWLLLGWSRYRFARQRGMR